MLCANRRSATVSVRSPSTRPNSDRTSASIARRCNIGRLMLTRPSLVVPPYPPVGEDDSVPIWLYRSRLVLLCGPLGTVEGHDPRVEIAPRDLCVSDRVNPGRQGGLNRPGSDGFL